MGDTIGKAASSKYKILCRGRKLVLGQIVDNIKGEEKVYDALIHPGAVVIVAIKDNEVLVERQYRPIIGRWIYELPAGTIEEGEDPSRTAERELLEETGYRANKIEYLGWFYTSPGTSTEVIHVFLARNLVRVNMPMQESDELIEIEWISLDDIWKFISKGAIVDAKTIAALALYDQKMKLHNK